MTATLCLLEPLTEPTKGTVMSFQKHLIQLTSCLCCSTEYCHCCLFSSHFRPRCPGVPCRRMVRKPRQQKKRFGIPVQLCAGFVYVVIFAGKNKSVEHSQSRELKQEKQISYSYPRDRINRRGVSGILSAAYYCRHLCGLKITFRAWSLDMSNLTSIVCVQFFEVCEIMTPRRSQSALVMR